MNVDLYGKYLEDLLAGRRSQCRDLVLRLLEDGMDVKDLYIRLFQESMYEVGRLWETARISVATEHLATSITEFLLTLVYPKIFAAEHLDKLAIISCTANEYHQIGGKMVADIFELNGWHGHFLGANTPTADLAAMIREKDPDVLALSLSVYFNMPKLFEILDQLKDSFPQLPIILGGQAFRWGWNEVEVRYPGVRVLSSLDALESYISEAGH